MSETFRHVDRDQTIVFGAGALDAAGELLSGGYTLLTTPRASASAPALAEGGGHFVDVPDASQPVDQLAASSAKALGADV